MQQGGCTPGACAAQWVTQRNGPTIHIHLLAIQSQLVTAVCGLQGEWKTAVCAEKALVAEQDT